MNVFEVSLESVYWDLFALSANIMSLQPIECGRKEDNFNVSE